MQRIAGGRSSARRGARLDDDKLAVKDCAVGNAVLQSGELGKALADQFLAARPRPPLPGAMDVLRTDAVEFPFHQPVLDRPQQRRHVRDRSLKRRREKASIWMGAPA